MRHRSRKPNRQGQSLILIFFALIALIGVMALTLDYGFILLARRQIQTGVNAAALEGLRFADPDGRQHASDLMRNIYDDDLDPTNNQTTIGAGIDKSIIQGDGFQSVTIGDGVSLSNTLANRSRYVYRPDPQLNVANEVHGDFVRGQPSMIASPLHSEQQDYTRDDLLPDPTGDLFLARLRRTHNPNGLDQVPDVSSSGGGLPLIIGNLTWFTASESLPSYSIRRDGVIVRATAIAQERVAVRVSESIDNRVYGALPFAIFGSELSAGNIATQIQATDYARVSVGEPVGSLTPASLPPTPGYIAVVEQVMSTNRVVGFHLFDPAGPPRQSNASPRLQDAWTFLSALTDAERISIQDFQNDPMLRSQLVKVPALVRSVR